MAQGKIANLSVGVSLDAAEFVNGLSEADRAAQNWQQNLVKSAVIAGAAIGTALAAGVASFVASIGDAANAMDAFNDLKDATGASIENISALDEVARRTGGSFETVEGSLIKFNKALADAGENGAGDAIKAIGLDLQSLKQLDPAEALRQTAVALSGFEDNANKARVTQELFGKSLKEAAPFLKDLSEQGSLVASTTTEQAQAAEDYNKSIYAMTAELENAKREMAAEFLPILTDIIKSMKGGGGIVREFGAIALDVFQAVTVVGSDVGFVFLSVGREIGSWAAQLGALASGNLREFHAISDAVKEDGERARKELDAFQARVMSLGKGVKIETPVIEVEQPKPSLKDPAETEAERKAKAEREKAAAAAAAKAAAAARSATEKAQESSRRYVDNLDKQISKLNELTAVEKVVDDIMKGRVKFDDAAQAGRAIGLAQEIDQHKRLTDQLAAETAQHEALKAAQANRLAEVKRLTDEARTPAQAYADEIARLDDLTRNAGLSAQAYSVAVKAAGDAMFDSQKKAKAASDGMTAFSEQAARNIQDALGNTLEETLSGNFDSIGQMWVKLIQKMAAQALAAKLNAALFGDGADFSKFIGKLFSGTSSSGSYDSGGGFSAGTDGTASLPWLDSGTNYVARDGLAMIHQGEAVVPKKYNPANGGMGSGMVFDFSGQVIQVGSDVSRSEVMAAVQAGNAETEARIRRSLKQRAMA